MLFFRRIESCIQRFRGRRRLQGEQTRYFNEYLFLGGIDSNPVPFSGCDPKDLKGLTPAEQRDAKAGTTIGGVDNEEQFYTGDRETWSVDFTGIAAGFFSSMGPITGFEPEPTEMAIGVVENFLRYVLHHDVCPEYDADVKKALKVCEDAREEIPMLLRFQAALPGQFNLAAAKMFGVHGEHDWSFHGFAETGSDPKLNIIASLALMEEPEMFARISQGDHRVVRQFECTVEVTEIQRPDAEILRRFESFELINADGTPTPALSPIGKAKFKPAVIEDAWEDPVTTPKCRLTLFLDDDILANMKLGMKISLTVCELDFGLRFVKTVHEVVPTYFTFLPQQLMRYFRSPRDEERPAPSVHDRAGDGEDAGQGGEES